MPLRIPLETGDQTPLFSAPADINPNFAFGSLGGRWMVLLFFGALANPLARAAHLAVLARREQFDDIDACYFGVSVDPDDRTVRGLKATPPGVRYFYDHDKRVSRLYGVAEEDGGYRPTAFLIDRAMRIAAVEPVERIDALLAAMDQYMRDEALSPAQLMAPVLTVPRVFEPELCQTLIDYYRARGGRPSGVMRNINGMTVGVFDDNMKRRKDVKIDDGDLQDMTRDRIGRRLIPEIPRAFNWRATRIERYMVACYEGTDGGFFNPHRDNNTAGTAHRVFAVTLNLNSEYEGGELVFPEFGPRNYKPPPGGATVFSCSLLHAATPVTS